MKSKSCISVILTISSSVAAIRICNNSNRSKLLRIESDWFDIQIHDDFF